MENLKAAPPVELLYRADQPHVALLDQVQQGQAAVRVALGDRDHQPEVGLDHRVLGRHVVLLDPRRASRTSSSRVSRRTWPMFFR